MFIVIPITREVVGLVNKTFKRKSLIRTGSHVRIDLINMDYIFLMTTSPYDGVHTYLPTLTQESLDQMLLLHSLGLSPKEIAEIINGESDDTYSREHRRELKAINEL